MCKNCNDTKIVHGINPKYGICEVGPCPICNSNGKQASTDGLDSLKKRIEKFKKGVTA